jgi:transcriptional regulator with XRE-family HTH domain
LRFRYIVPVDVASRLRQLRRRSGLTQAELAERTGISQSVLSLYERGHRRPSAEVFLHLVDSLGFRLDFVARLPAARSAMAPELVGRVLPDLLGLADALPAGDPGPLSFPRLPIGHRR